MQSHKRENIKAGKENDDSDRRKENQNGPFIARFHGAALQDSARVKK